MRLLNWWREYRLALRVGREQIATIRYRCECQGMFGPHEGICKPKEKERAR